MLKQAGPTVGQRPAAGRGWTGWPPPANRKAGTAAPPPANPRPNPQPPRPPGGAGAGAVTNCGRHADDPQGFQRVLRFSFFEHGHIFPVNPFGNRMGGWVRTGKPAPSTRGATVYGSQRAGSRGVLRGQPLIPRGFVRNWVRQRAYKSVKVEGCRGPWQAPCPAPHWSR